MFNAGSAARVTVNIFFSLDGCASDDVWSELVSERSRCCRLLSVMKGRGIAVLVDMSIV